MPILVRNIRLGLDEPEENLIRAAARRLRVPEAAIRTYAAVRRSLDARRKDEIVFLYQVELELDEPPGAQRKRLQRGHIRQATWLSPPPKQEPVPGSAELRHRPIVIGFGPGGMFAALRLAQFGYRPVVLERGRDVRRRHRDVLKRFFRERDLDPSSNLWFGEGGAGTYSDGKLYTRLSDPRCRTVLETFYQHGADPEILIDARPHIGSDRLPSICKRIRRRIESLGGEVSFDCHVDDIRITDGGLDAIHVTGPGHPRSGAWLEAGPTVLAVGQSARDTIRRLHERGVRIEPKPFQMGVRIEHPQSLVDRWQYGTAAGHPRLPPAEYHVVAKRAAGPRGDVFSFCMCPGGIILPTAEASGRIATNGASRSSRSGPFANSGLVITVDPAALSAKNGPDLALETLIWLERWEQKAFEGGGGQYGIPIQRASDFLRGAASDGLIETSCPLGARWADLAGLIPEPVADALRAALPILDRKLPGYAGGNGLIAASETRASAAVRVLRDAQTREAVETCHLYPVGEGAGYAGGIISAAVDGLKTADAIIERYAPPR
jgi:uncharacterized FAD-dependent dehydrogenase